ncbi:hypothetical protein HY468_05815 [Candidatus Roizmanbacteria bacterium]|nr:hypothetical protein [Candidatus Roizmanbacteria bacterium]
MYITSHLTLMNNSPQLPKKIAILYSHVQREYFPTEEQYITEKDAAHDAAIVAEHVKKLGLTPLLFAADPTLPERIRKEKPEMVLNLVDSVKGDEFLSSAIPGVLELLEIPYTGAGILGLAINCNKFITKELLQQNGIPVPRFQMLANATDPLDSNFRFPVISKLNEIHGSVEITEEAVSENEQELLKRIKKLIALYHQPVLIEEYIEGRELTVMLLEGSRLNVYNVEKVFHRKPKKYLITTFSDQWKESQKNIVHYEKFTDLHLDRLARRAFDALAMADYAKFDVRVDKRGQYFFIDANCNPAFGPVELECAIADILAMYGISFAEILRRLFINTMNTAHR